MSVPTTEVKSSSKGSNTMATLEEVMKGPVVQEKYTCRSIGWEADELHSTLTCAHQLEKIVTVAGIKPSASGVFHRLPRDDYTQPKAKLISESQSVDDFNLSKELASIKAQAAAGRALRIEAITEQTTSRPKLPFSVPNTGAPNTSTSEACKSPLTIHRVPSVQDYSGCRPVEFDEQLQRFRMPPFRWAQPMDELLDALALTYSPEVGVPQTRDPTVTPGRSSSSIPQVVLIDEEEGEEEGEILPPLDRKGKGKMVETEVDEYTVPLGIVLTPIPTDEERTQLQIAKHNYATTEYTKGNAEVEALKKVLKEHQDSFTRSEYAGNVWDLNLDPLTDWFNHFVGPTLAPFASEITSHFAAGLTQLPMKIYVACAFTNPIYQI
uniref:Uncharacterized protein n=1 Tax=Cannabis sativa TaxID=3483 RepID=A0A803Q7D7_CANSA